MSKFFKSFFSRKSLFPEIKTETVDTDHLDASLKLLQSTTAEVSAAAIDAAQTLQRELKDSQYRFYQTVDSLEDLVMVKDGKGRWKMLNRKAQEVFQCFHREFIDLTDEEIAKIRPEIAMELSNCTVTDAVAWKMKQPNRSVECIPMLDGAHYFDVIKTPVFYPDGEPKEMIIVGRDVTEERERNKRNKACFTALNSASDAIVIIDRSQKIYFCNDKFLEINGIKDYHDIVGEHFDSRWTCGEVDIQQMWDSVTHNVSWTGTCGCSTINMLPVMNGSPVPIYYICTIKKKPKDK